MLTYCGNITPFTNKTASVLNNIATTTTAVVVVGVKSKAVGKRSNIHLNTRLVTTTAGLLAAAAICLVPAESIAIQPQPHGQEQEQTDGETLSNIPQNLSSDDTSNDTNNNRTGRIKRPKSSKAESCTGKCVGTCIRGGYGAPGEGPLNVRRPLVVFKEGFRSRHYCLVECSDICNLIRDGDDGP